MKSARKRPCPTCPRSSLACSRFLSLSLCISTHTHARAYTHTPYTASSRIIGQTRPIFMQVLSDTKRCLHIARMVTHKYKFCAFDSRECRDQEHRREMKVLAEMKSFGYKCLCSAIRSRYQRKITRMNIKWCDEKLSRAKEIFDFDCIIFQALLFQLLLYILQYIAVIWGR